MRVLLTIQGERRCFWRAVDQDGHILDILVQRRRDKQAAKTVFRKLLKGLKRVPRVMVTDQLKSYEAAKRETLPDEGYLSMTMHRFPRVLAVLLLAGCAPTWQPPPGMSPAAQAQDQAACEEEGRQAAMAQTGSGTDAAVARIQTLSQCLEARGWRAR
jgi:DDE domain